MKNLLLSFPVALPPRSAQSDEDSSDSDYIDDCSEADSTESEIDDDLFLNEVQTFNFVYFISCH